MTLRLLFTAPIVLMLLVTLGLAAMITSREWSDSQRGEVAIRAVERARLLSQAEARLSVERVATNLALGSPFPLTAQVPARLADARRVADHALEALDVNFRTGDGMGGGVLHAEPEPLLNEMRLSLAKAREEADAMLARDWPDRPYDLTAAVMPRMLAASRALVPLIGRSGRDVVAAEPGLSGLIAVSRISVMLREHFGEIAAILLPRLDFQQRPSAGEVSRVRLQLAQAVKLIQAIENTIYVAAPSDRILTALVALKAAHEGVFRPRLTQMLDTGVWEFEADGQTIRPRQLLVTMAEPISAFRDAIVDETVVRVKTAQAARTDRMNAVVVAVGAVVIVMLASLALLHLRVVGPLARLGAAIRRIAGGDRTTALSLHATTREIAAMVTAVETLRLAALVADATAMRQREAARKRLDMLREALTLVRKVREPARDLERGVARLSEGIESTIALLTTPTTPPPATLSTAAAAVRRARRDMRDSAGVLEAVIAASGTGDAAHDCPEAELLARILSVQTCVDEQEAAVRGFIQPGLAALREASDTQDVAPALRDLVSDQFERIEAAVASVSSMRAAVTQAVAILGNLPPDTASLAA